MHPILIFMALCLLGIYGCFKWMMYLIRDDKDEKINILTKGSHGAQ
jgi:hypothetical protein